MIHLGGLPYVLDVFVVASVLVWLWRHADRLIDSIGAGLRLHRTQLQGDGRVTRVSSSSPGSRPSPHPTFAPGGHQRKRS